MLIVSQDKKKIANLATTELIDISEKFGIRVFQVSDMDSFLEIASYENEERANIVLNRLCSAYANNDKVFFMP